MKQTKCAVFYINYMCCSTMVRMAPTIVRLGLAYVLRLKVLWLLVPCVVESNK